MKTLHIGLDFGTKQSKVCVFDVDSNNREFFRFSNGSFFLPSRVGLKSDSTFEYGEDKTSHAIKEYYYFKIASAEDEEFNVTTYGKNVTDKYNPEDFNPYTPEFLSVIYLTYLLFTIKESLISKNKGIRTKNTGFLSRLLPLRTNVDIRFTVQMGIPTQWSQPYEINLKRKRKFQSILMIAESLQSKYTSREEFLKSNSLELQKNIESIYKSSKIQSLENFNSKLNQLGVSVYPETAAALRFIREGRLLTPGFYAIIDIGAGSTDISFFQLLNNNNIKYLASESYMVAANNVYKYFCKGSDIAAIHIAENEVMRLIEEGNWELNESLMNALRQVNKELCGLVPSWQPPGGLNKSYNLFNKRVYFFQNNILNEYRNQPIILYGGGANFPIISAGNTLIHDNGVNNFNAQSRMEKHHIINYTDNVEVLPSDRSWEENIDILTVALGLSYISYTGDAEWAIADEYRPVDGGDGQPLIPHPVNADCYIYDVLKRNWYQ